MRIAATRWARLRGLALLRGPPAEPLLIPRCRSVHTFGMRFALDLVWLDDQARVLRVDRGVGPGRVRSCRAAAAVLELPHGMIPAVAETGEQKREESQPVGDAPDDTGQRTRAALDPRQRIYRDRFNEYFVFALSATGAGVIAPVVLYIVMAFTGLWTWWGFALACVAVELVLIFGIARPQMKRHEAAGWAALWSFMTGVLAVCFFFLVASSTL
jgi:uncharacterized membrane protein (UPF0127 family)